MWNLFFGPTQEAEQGLLNNSSRSYNTMSTLQEVKPNSQATEDDALVNIVSSLVEKKCVERAYKAVNIAIIEMQKRLAKEVISPIELDKTIKSFNAVKEILLNNHEWYGLALFGKLDIATRVDQMIAALETRKVSTHTSVASPSTYQ